MKKIYFVRHGESEGNVTATYHSGQNDRLTEVGQKQAAFIAERCSRLPIEFFVSSTMTRAKETANIISEKIGKPFEQSDLFVEVRRPSAQLGKHKDDPEAKNIDLHVIKNFGVPGFKHSDEENFEDLKKRAIATLDYLAKRPEENILVLTHGFFMRILVAYVVFGKDLTSHECEGFMRSFHTENTGVTVLGYDETRAKPWWVWVWNDHAHLAELNQA